jgi:uncharacterized membrane protein YfhO
VVIADTHFPGWTAKIDGGESSIFRVNYLVRGISVPAGRHRIEMVYVPEGWWYSATATRIGLLTWILGALLLVVTAWKRKGLRT